MEPANDKRSVLNRQLKRSMPIPIILATATTLFIGAPLFASVLIWMLIFFSALAGALNGIREFDTQEVQRQTLAELKRSNGSKAGE